MRYFVICPFQRYGGIRDKLYLFCTFPNFITSDIFKKNSSKEIVHLVVSSFVIIFRRTCSYVKSRYYFSITHLGHFRFQALLFFPYLFSNIFRAGYIITKYTFKVFFLSSLIRTTPHCSVSNTIMWYIHCPDPLHFRTYIWLQ